MTSFWKRLKYYLVGFSLGLIFVVFFFQNRGCSWLPGNRVKNTLLDKVLVIQENQRQIMEKHGLSNDEIAQFLNLGDVEFGMSLKDNNVHPKVFVISRTINEEKHHLAFSIYEDSYITLIHYLEEGQVPIRHTQPEGMGEFIRIPRDSGMVFIDKTPFLKCKSSPLQVTDGLEIARKLKASGKIDFEKSNLMLPKAEHFITYQENDTIVVKAKTIWFESRITFKDFYWDEPLDCEK
jgi:hypothetical protein